jgi:hypothetical protein
MSESFSESELLEALKAVLCGAARLASAERSEPANQSEPIGFLEAVEARLTGNWVNTDYDLPLEKAVNGDCDDRFLELLPGGGSFFDYLDVRGALKDLRRAKFRGHRERLRSWGFPLYSHRVVEGGFIIEKDVADRYLKVENLRIRWRSTVRKRKSRQR